MSTWDTLGIVMMMAISMAFCWFIANHIIAVVKEIYRDIKGSNEKNGIPLDLDI